MTSDFRRLAFCLPDLSGGGAERVALALMREFIARGREVDLVLANRRGPLLALVPPGVRIIDLGAPKLREALLPLIGYLRYRRPHALHAMMWPLTVIAISARVASRVPTRIVVSDHIALSRQYGGRVLTMRTLKWSTRLLYPLADARILVSESAADDLSALSGLSRELIDVIYNPLDLPRHLSCNRAAQAGWGAREAARIVTLGALKDQKNQMLLLHAFARVRKRRAARLAIVGDGALRPTLEAAAAGLGISNDVVFAGFVLDPWPWLVSADVFVLSSDYEGFGNVLVEALHAGLSVVSTDCKSGPREILGNGAFGRLVPCGDPDAMAAAIDEALDDPSDREEGRARASEISGTTSVDRHLATMNG